VASVADVDKTSMAVRNRREILMLSLQWGKTSFFVAGMASL
jgi:hypothetical protein